MPALSCAIAEERMEDPASCAAVRLARMTMGMSGRIMTVGWMAGRSNHLR